MTRMRATCGRSAARREPERRGSAVDAARTTAARRPRRAPCARSADRGRAWPPSRQHERQEYLEDHRERDGPPERHVPATGKPVEREVEVDPADRQAHRPRRGRVGAERQHNAAVQTAERTGTSSVPAPAASPTPRRPRIPAASRGGSAMALAVSARAISVRRRLRPRREGAQQRRDERLDRREETIPPRRMRRHPARAAADGRRRRVDRPPSTAAAAIASRRPRKRSG